MTETLYSESLKVQYKCQDAEDRFVVIKVTVELQTTTSPLHRKDLLVRLTDDKDPFFLFNLCLGEEDFQSLKTQQGLLVDFSAFPQRFIALLQQSHSEESRESPKFLLQFVLEESSSFSTSNSGCGILKVIETNPFKHLTHLSLNFLHGNDSDVKKYLASCLKSTLDHKAWLENKLSETEHDLGQKLEKTRQQLSCKSQELDQLRSDAGGKSERLTTKHAQELNMEREKTLKLQEDLQKRYDRERKDLDSTYQKNLRQKEVRLSELENVNKELTDRRYRAEATIREQKTKLASLDEEHRRCRSDLQQSRRENSSLEAERHSQEKTIQQMKTRVAVLEQELLDKEQLVARITSSLDASQQQKEQLDDRRSEQQIQIRKMEATIKTMSDELIKGNEIIKKLQDELRGYMGKVKIKNEVTTRQEKLIGEKEQMAEKTRKELEETTNKLKKSEDEATKLKDQLETALNKLEESKNLLKTNENVINWLNKQINEQHLVSRRNPPPPSIPSHPAPHPIPSQHLLPHEHHSSVNSFKPSFNHSAPNYSTPISVAPQPHLSANHSTPISAIGSSPHINLMKPQPSDGSRIPRPNVAGGAQVLYNPGKNKENLSPKSGADNSIDPKYLTRSADVITVRSLSPSCDTSPPKLSAAKPSTRLSQQVMNKATLGRPGHVRFQPQQPNSAVSAYFTGAMPKPS
ncbi:spindle assembly abnormal protein 6 homolog [Ciona intestinalis]